MEHLYEKTRLKRKKRKKAKGRRPEEDICTRAVNTGRIQIG